MTYFFYLCNGIIAMENNFFSEFKWYFYIIFIILWNNKFLLIIKTYFNLI